MLGGVVGGAVYDQGLCMQGAAGELQCMALCDSHAGMLVTGQYWRILAAGGSVRCSGTPAANTLHEHLLMFTSQPSISPSHPPTCSVGSPPSSSCSCA